MCIRDRSNMAEKRKELSPDVKNIIVSLRNEGYTLQHIADTLKIHCGTESRILIRLRKKWRTENKPRSGRLRLFDQRDERSLVMNFSNERRLYM